MFCRGSSTVTPVHAERDIHALKTAAQQNVAFLFKPHCGRKRRENGEAMPHGEAPITRFVRSGKGGRYKPANVLAQSLAPSCTLEGGVDKIVNCHNWPLPHCDWPVPRSCMALANHCGRRCRRLFLWASNSKPQVRLFPTLNAKFDLSSTVMRTRRN